MKFLSPHFRPLAAITVAPAVTALLHRLLCEIEAEKLEKGDLLF